MRKGRPKKDDLRKFSYRLRMNDTEKKLLDCVAVQYKCTKAEAVRVGLMVLYHLYTTGNADIFSDIMQKYGKG